MNKAQKRLSTFQKGINKAMKVIGITLGSLAVGKLIKDSISAAMNVENSMLQIQRTMGNSANAFNHWAQTQAKAYGMAREEAFKYGATYSNLISSFTKDTQETARYTTELLKASAVVASATGRTMEDTMERIRSGLLGNTEAIEDLGIHVNVAMLESTEAFRQFARGRSWQQLTFQEQQQIRLLSILEQANIKYGDSLAGTTQTRQAIFITSLKNIQLNLGQAFLPIYNVVLPALTAMGNAIERVTSNLKYFTQAIFGKTIPPVVTGEQTAAISGMGDAAETAGEQVKQAGKNVKKSLASFDEINSLTDGSTAGGATSAPNVPTPGLTDGQASSNEEEISPAVQKAIDKLLGLLEPLKNINLDNLKTAFENLKTAMEPITETLFAGIHWAYLNIFIPLSKWTAEKALPAFLEVLAGALKVLSSVLDVLKPLGVWLWDNFLAPITRWTGGVIVNVLDKIGGALSRIGDWISEHKGIVQAFAIIVGSFAAAWGLVNIAIGAWNVIGAIATGITTAFGAAFAFLTSPITLVVLAIGSVIAIVVLLIKHWDDVKLAASNAWAKITEAWGKAPEWFSSKVLGPIKEGFEGAVNFLVGLAEGWTNRFIRGINAIIEALNSLRIDVPKDIPFIGGMKFGLNIPTVKEISLPRLANGMVIHPNDEFLAILGDQKSGINIEAPLATIEQALRNVLAERGRTSGNGTIQATFIVEGREWARLIAPYIIEENNRMGVRLIDGVI